MSTAVAYVVIVGSLIACCALLRAAMWMASVEKVQK